MLKVAINPLNKKNLLITLRLLCVLCGEYSYSAAQLNIAPSYSYLYANEWDEIFQTYNFSRPWQEEKLSPFTYGYGASLGFDFVFSEKGQVWINPQIHYARFSSAIENSGEKISARVQLFEGSIEFRINPKALLKRHGFVGPIGPRWFLSIAPGYTFFLPDIKRNGEWVEIEEGIFYQPLTSSFHLSAGSGYHSLVVGRFVLTPKISAAWFPYAEFEEFAETLNGHNQTELHNGAENMLIFNASIQLTLLPKDKSWWNKTVVRIPMITLRI